MAGNAPGGWLRVQQFIDASGLVPALGYVGVVTTPAQRAELEARALRDVGADVRVDGTGHPVVFTADPVVREWARELDGATQHALAAGDAALERSREASYGSDSIRIDDAAVAELFEAEDGPVGQYLAELAGHGADLARALVPRDTGHMMETIRSGTDHDPLRRRGVRLVRRRL